MLDIRAFASGWLPGLRQQPLRVPLWQDSEGHLSGPHPGLTSLSQRTCAVTSGHPKLPQGVHGAPHRSTGGRGRKAPATQAAGAQPRTEPPPWAREAVEGAASTHSMSTLASLRPEGPEGQARVQRQRGNLTPGTLQTSLSHVLHPHGPPSQADGPQGSVTGEMLTHFHEQT